MDKRNERRMIRTIMTKSSAIIVLCIAGFVGCSTAGVHQQHPNSDLGAGAGAGGFQRRRLQFISDAEAIIVSDLFSDTLELLSGSPGFDGIIGIVPLNQQNVVAAGGAWDSQTESCPLSSSGESSSPPPDNILTSAAPTSATNLLYDCQTPPIRLDGMPVCFSWPILPSSLHREYVQYTRTDGEVFSPNCISLFPNHEFNERHCFVMFDDFLNRNFPDEEGYYGMDRLDIVGDLMFVGPNGQLKSGKGLFRVADVNDTPYLNGPVFVGARLSPLTTTTIAGEGSIGPFNIAGQAVWPNSGLDLYPQQNNTQDGQEVLVESFLFQLRLLYSGGMTPDGVKSLQPTMFDDYFTLQFGSGATIEKANQPLVMNSNTTVIVLGLADTGQRQDEYDICYQEDRDNYIDIIIQVQQEQGQGQGGQQDGPTSGVRGGDVLADLTSVLAFSKGKTLFNPGGPGLTPTLGVRYTAGAPLNQTVPVLVDLDGEFSTTYCENDNGEISTVPATCIAWRTQQELKSVPVNKEPISPPPPEESDSDIPSSSPTMMDNTKDMQSSAPSGDSSSSTPPPSSSPSPTFISDDTSGSDASTHQTFDFVVKILSFSIFCTCMLF